MSWESFNSHKQYHIIQGFIRLNYDGYVPKDIVLLCYLFFNGDELNLYVETIKQFDILSSTQVSYLCTKLKEILMEESNIINLNITNDNNKLIVVGDIRAQYYDLTGCIFDKYGYPTDKKDSPRYLFLGNYTSRGYYHTETLLLLYSLKARYPSKITLLRGNAESLGMAQTHSCLYEDMMGKYGGAHEFLMALDIFNYLPLCATINNEKIFAIHSGLSPSIETLEQILLIDRLQDIPHEGGMCDFVWSSPGEEIDGWGISPRGAGYLFGRNVVDKFFKKNGIKVMIRSSNMVEGFEWLFDKKVLHIFSAPNYCYRCGNVASVAIIDKDSNIECETFEAVPHDKRPKIKNPIPDYWL